MPKRFLNVEYSGTRTEIDVTEAERLSEVQDALKAKYGPVMAEVGAPQLQLCDQQGQHINKWALFNSLHQEYFDEGGPCLVIRTTPPPSRHPTRESSKNELFGAGSTSFLSSEESLSRKRPRYEIIDLTNKLKSFANAQLVEECIQSQDQAFLPYPQDKIKTLYVRKCYQDVFNLLIHHISLNETSFAISGTPGIGKSLFFVYILYRLMADFRTKTLSLKPNRILYQMGSTFECFDLQQHIVTRTLRFDAEGLVREKDTFYIIDGRNSEPLVSSCIVLFISSPRSEWYKDFVKQRMAKEFYFPVWNLDELQACQTHCHQGVPIAILQNRYRICGGVARFVFHKDISIPVPRKMQSALNDVNAVCGVKYVGETTDIFPSSHTLLQIQVGDDEFGNPYQFTELDVASKYVGEQLWIRYSAQMITHLQEMFGSIPNEISRHLFEIYGHLVFSVGGQTLKCRCLESGIVTEMTLDKLNNRRVAFGKDTIPTAVDSNYYEPTDKDTFPAIDSLSRQGMFQFTVAAEHPIRGVQILQRLCQLYDEPKLYFVVPPHQFGAFKKQGFKANTGTDAMAEIPKLKQYVLELPIIPQKFV